MKPKFQLVTRADDAGSCSSANHAILRCVEAGTIKNVSFMACGPAIEEAARMFRGRDDIAMGLHVCLNAEWEDVKWGPLLESRFLTDENGSFWPTPAQTKENGWTTEAVLDEIAAQREKLRELGLKISYADEHMGVSWIGFRDDLARFCADEGLFDAAKVPSLRSAANLEAQLRAANGERCVWINHPGFDAPDMQNFNLPGQPKGVVARERAAETEFLCGEEIHEIFRQWRVEAVRYDEISSD